jgi:CRISPR-associated protein Cas2
VGKRARKRAFAQQFGPRVCPPYAGSRKLAGSEFLSRPLHIDRDRLLPRIVATCAAKTKEFVVTMETRLLYLAAYDVCDPRRLRAALDLVKGYSTGGQKSVHECFLTAGERARLLCDMEAVLNESEDSFLLLRLDPRARVFTLGKAIEPMDAPYFHVA